MKLSLGLLYVSVLLLVLHFVLAVDINSCQDLDTAGTTYRLTQDVSSADTCFSVLANRVTLDCRGFEINYSQSARGHAVEVNDQNGTLVRSCVAVQGNPGSPSLAAFGFYVHNDAVNITIVNNTLRTYGDFSYAVYLEAGSRNGTITNNSIRTTEAAAYGVYLDDTVSGNDISHNNITTLNSLGISLETTVHSNKIHRNNITTFGNNRMGIQLSSMAYNNDLYGNRITTNGVGSNGLVFSWDAFGNRIFENIITTDDERAHGLFFQSGAYSNNVSDNTINTSGPSSKGIYLNNNIYNNTFHDNNVTAKDANGAYGIYLVEDINNNTFYRNRISSPAAGIVVSGEGQAAGESTRGNNFTGDIILPCSVGCSSSHLAVNITDGAHDVTFLNVSFNKSLVRVEAGGNNLTVRWYLELNVINLTDGNALEGAEVTLNDSFDTTAFKSNTDQQGRIPQQAFTEFTMNGSVDFNGQDSCIGIDNPNITCFSPYNVSINLTGYVDSDETIQLNRSTFFTATMEFGPLRINSNATVPASPIENDETYISANVTQTNGDEIFWVNFTVQAPNGTYILNATNASVTGEDLWNSTRFNVTDVGLWRWNITAYDGSATVRTAGSFLIPAWHILFGNLTGRLALQDEQGSSLLSWDVFETTGSNVYVADSDSSITFSALEALGRTVVGDYVKEDFGEADNLLRMTNLTDSINASYVLLDGLPDATRIFSIFGRDISDVPVVNSSNNSFLLSGILWDTDDDSGDGGFDEDDREDLVFITSANVSTHSQYGIYDYEIRIPARLRDYHGGANSVSIYSEIR